MAKLYVFEGIDEKKQLISAAKYAKAGFDVEAHYHHAWNFDALGDREAQRIPCNEKCTLVIAEESG